MTRRVELVYGLNLNVLHSLNVVILMELVIHNAKNILIIVQAMEIIVLLLLYVINTQT